MTEGGAGDDREAMTAARDAAARLHAPVMLAEVRAALEAGRGGVYLDGTFGAGGYACALLEDGAEQVIGVDRDPEAIRRAEIWAPLYEGRLTLVEGRFGALDAIAAEQARGPVMGVALDLGVSSMQLDQAERGFSFLRDGPLDMRMGFHGQEAGESAADLVNRADEALLADILFHYGEERASRRIARAIVQARAEAPITRTAQLAEICERALPRPKPGQPHPATRSFQALRIAVNDELGELLDGLAAAERTLAPDGVLAVVSFHSLEDRIVKRFLKERSAKTTGGSRYSPIVNHSERSFEPIGRGAGTPGEDEIARNPRARSAKLRAARRLDAPAHPVEAGDLAALRLLETRGPGRGKPRGRARKERR